MAYLKWVSNDITTLQDSTRFTADLDYYQTTLDTKVDDKMPQHHNTVIDTTTSL